MINSSTFDVKPIDKRLRAFHLLSDVIKKKIPLHFTDQDDSLVKMLCFGMCRHYFYLQALCDLIVKKPTDSDINLVILMGLYQLLFLEKPAYATVKETVNLLLKIKKGWAKGFVNAVLRRVCREKQSLLLQMAALPLSIHYPEWLLQELQENWPGEWETIIEASNRHPPMTLRVNQQKISRDAYVELLTLAQKKSHITPYSSVGIILDTPCPIIELPDFSKGLVSLQDEASQLAITHLSLAPGLRVLDACAAPGGKTAHMLESEPGLAALCAIDIDPLRLSRISENLARLNLSATVVSGDAAIPHTWWDGHLFDRILLDAPCSATGVIRRHPDIKLIREASDIDILNRQQAVLLERLWPLLAKGGMLLYTTCSILKRENEKQIADFLLKTPDAQVQPLNAAYGRKVSHGIQLLPGDCDSDGFFYSLLLKRE